VFFDSVEFGWFFLAVYAVYWGLVRAGHGALLLLFGASYLFYGQLNPWMLLLIATTTVLDWFVSLRIHASESPGRRRAWLLVSVLTNLGILSWFKYANFALESVGDVARLAGLSLTLPVLHVALPPGISFFTFQSLSYTIDVYRRHMKPERHLLRFATFIAFFPQLVAGPIVRAADFIPQLRLRPAWDARKQSAGIALVTLGLIKKVAIANPLALHLVDRVFDAPGNYSSVEALAGVYGYAVQIYCDFSGYTDVAIGAALLLGFELTPNFDRPYRATDLQEFWHRWHISLSSWLRDYLYIPLGGNRGSAWLTYRNLMLTMLLGGLWHGASWNFVIWGALHGGALAVTRAWQRRDGHVASTSPLARFAKGLATFHFVCFAWIFFRSPTFDDALDVLASLSRLTTYTPNLAGWVVALIGGSLLWHITPARLRNAGVRRFVEAPVLLQALALLGIAIALQRIKGAAVVPFIYFQF
jgi:D-alanyl-lipoteichoic acid acyltransferase DltB (MBOAT superfamily)